jgi:hypothetical protein
MADTRSRHRGEDVTGRGLEELEDGGVLERRRVRHVDDHRGVLDHLREPLAGERVHPGVRGRGDRVVALGLQVRDHVGPDEAGSTDDDHFHDDPSF